MFLEILEGLPLGPVVGILLEIPEPGSVFFPIDDIDPLHS